MGSKPLAEQRFSVPISQCDVHDRRKLAVYRKQWLKWMGWYEHTPHEPHSIESQIQRMIFNDLTYRAIVSVRGAVPNKTAIAARAPTLAYLVDQGYVLSQVLAIQKLLDNRNDVISISRLLKDVEKNYLVITREIYVSGDGTPYDYNSWAAAVPKPDPAVQIWGLESPGLARYALSRQLHQAFDVLSGRPADQRGRDDTIRESVFRVLHSWLSGDRAQELKEIRNKFLAHAADSLSRGKLQFNGVKLSVIDELQRAIIRVERSLMDYILSIRVERDVVPVQPLGIFAGLDLPYAPPGAGDSMDKCWRDLKTDRNSWKHGILQDLDHS
jgi:hypothetical protein